MRRWLLSDYGLFNVKVALVRRVTKRLTALGYKVVLNKNSLALVIIGYFRGSKYLISLKDINKGGYVNNGCRTDRPGRK